MSRHQHHSMINDITWRAKKCAQIPAHKELMGFNLSNGKRLDGAKLIPWSRGRALAWDVTIPDTYAASHLQITSTEVGSAAKQAARIKITKYQELIATHIFCRSPLKRLARGMKKKFNSQRTFVDEPHRRRKTQGRQSTCSK